MQTSIVQGFQKVSQVWGWPLFIREYDKQLRAGANKKVSHDMW